MTNWHDNPFALSQTPGKLSATKSVCVRACALVSACVYVYLCALMNRRHGGGISPVTGNCPIRETWMSGNKALNKEGWLLLTELHCLLGKTMSSPLFSASGIRASLSSGTGLPVPVRRGGVVSQINWSSAFYLKWGKPVSGLQSQKCSLQVT